MGKPFKTYDELVDKLENEKGLSVPNRAHLINLLKEYSYYDLISGYKEPFKDKTGNYIAGTTIDDIYALYVFDSNLRSIMLGAILTVEKKMKSLLSYAFTECYGDSQQAYLHPGSYKATSTDQAKRIKRLIKILVDIVTPPFDHAYIRHQWEKHSNVPLWVAVKAMTLGNISQIYSLLPDRIQAHVSKEFPCVTEGALANMLSYLTFIRNVSAHNERLYDFGANQSKSIPDMPIHSALKIGKKGKMYKYGKNDLFAAIICLKYLLPKARFERLIVDIDREIEILLSKTHRVQKSYLFNRMGFPVAWKDILRYD